MGRPKPLFHERSTPAGQTSARGIQREERGIDAVVLHFSRLGGPMYTHEKVTLSVVAKSIARLKGHRFAGEFDPKAHAPARHFFVPSDTLIFDEARTLGIHSSQQLYGAVVPYPFVKTKAITHHLIGAHASRPSGWSSAFADNVHSAVLPGYTVFCADDAKLAAKRLLVLGAVRLKEPLGDGGHGQVTIGRVAELEAYLENFPAERLASHGLVLETNLRHVITRSVGCTTIGSSAIAYHGTQRTVTNNHGLSVYGGSHLICVRGGWSALEELPMEADARLAVGQARVYDRNATKYPDFLASRRNYDVGQGVDGNGQWRSGVFEASWRSGGASTAELAALTAFADDSSLQVVETTAVKEYGKSRRTSTGAAVHFHGDDPDEGPLIRYTRVARALRQVA
ncbi:MULTISPECIES: DUF3182 family protein [unclassified Bradyrhizobium]|uniref:DUF3182 family protein n=1 Tax=unclassified Bradyrhizobium TaxID=2631580 RepID=UPI00247A88AA|nr:MULTISPECIES: DUF3182 family protein [unclassified Bradyrhizobium]WGS17360.1 DUF3182 family protein [Bradyrhizobium sp. ISRA463]WGS31096.1 DUF3182 family protein [Bradyrhizobium sp. ISRA464]